MSGILVGPAVITTGEPDWEANRAIVRAMRAEIARVRTPIGFGFRPERLADLVADGVRTVLLCGEDGDVTPERTWDDLVRWLPVIAAHPEVRWIIELGNEPDMVAGVDIWQHRYHALQTLQHLPRVLGRPQFQWAISLPCNLAQTRDLLARDEHGCILDHVDAICTHVYGWYDLGDGGGGDWLRILDLAVDIGLPVYISEAGIDDRATPRPEKVRRYLRWLETAPAGVTGVCFWGLGAWEANPTYELTREMAEILATRHAAPQAPQAPPPPVAPPTEGNMLYGIRGLIDRRGELPRNPNGGPGTRVPLSGKRGIVVHYNGPPVRNHTDSAAAWQQVVRDAQYHVDRDWDEDPANGRVLRGDGLMYHIAIGPQGEKWLCRSPEDVLWHCGAWPHNATALSILVPIGGDQRATRAQLIALAEVCDDWLHQGRGTAARDVWGHQELQPTSCPGTLMADFILPYRAGVFWQELRRREEEPVADGRYFPETGHYVGHGFWEYWRDNGGLMIFGYPLTDEIEEPDPKAPGGKRVVQYFERAVFEWHPENDPPYRVLLRRLGAEALARSRPAASTSGTSDIGR